jgi:hypothetical protein
MASLAMTTAVPNGSLLASFDAFLRQARRLEGQGADRLAHDHVLAALGVAMAVAREAAQTALEHGAGVGEALEAGIAQLQAVRLLVP